MLWEGVVGESAVCEDVCRFGEIMESKRFSNSFKATMARYPADPIEFRAAQPSAFAEGEEPIACRLDEATIIERCRKEKTPCRSTNKKVRLSTGSPGDKGQLVVDRAE